jgi:ribonuclease T2
MRTLTLFGALSCLILTAAFPARAQAPGKPGQFDFYLLTLSWSPEFCHGHPQDSQCSEHKGFLVHGLWPQYNNGQYPANCVTEQPPPTDISPVSGIMPQEIIAHEWQKHGTCSGLSGDDYLALIRKVFNSIKVPARFQAPSQTFTEQPAELKQDFEQANPALTNQAIAIQLFHGYLNAVEICFSNAANPTPIACSNVQDARGGPFKVAPVR